MKKHLMLLTAVIGACLMGGISTANATATLRLTSGATQITVGDQSGLDAYDAAVDPVNSIGVVTYIGTVGANWTVNTSTGLTFPASGYTSASGHMDVSSLNRSAGAGTLTIEFSEVGFDSLSAAQEWYSGIGGTLTQAGGSVTYKVYAGTGLFDLGTLLTDIGPLTTTPFSGVDNGFFGPSASHSLTMQIVINHRGAGTTSFDAETMRTPEGGSTVAMLGLALLGLGGMTAFRKQQARA